MLSTYLETIGLTSTTVAPVERLRAHRALMRDMIATTVLGVLLCADALLFAQGNVDIRWSHFITGALVVGFSLITIAGVTAARFAVAAMGIWLMLTPLAFWAPYAVTYNSDTTTGALLVLFSIVFPSYLRRPAAGSDIPP